MARPFEFKREEVLQKATWLFWDRGYSNTSAQDLVKHLGVNRSSIYNSFSDKRTLFLEALKTYVNSESEAMTTFLTSMPPNPSSIKELLEMVVEANIQGKGPKGCLIVNSAIEFADTDQQVLAIIESNVREVTERFTEFLEKGQNNGTINTRIKAKELALALFHQITAFRVTGKVIRDRAFFSNTISAFIKLFHN